MNLEKTIKNYEMSAAAHAVVQKTKLLLIASIAGGGKDTVVRELVKTGDFHRIVTHTTRQPRINHGTIEVNGEDYYFIDQHMAAEMLRNKEFVEAKYVHGNIYGTSVAEVQKASEGQKFAVTDIDIQGVVEYLDVKPDTHAVFLLPPSVDRWIERLSRRYEGDLSDHQDELQKRFRTAYDEIKHIQADKRFVLIINDDLETTVKRVLGVLNGSVQRSSGYADKVTEHLIDYLETKI